MSAETLLEARLRAKDEGLVGQLNAAEQRALAAAGGLNTLSTAARGTATATAAVSAADREAARASAEVSRARKDQERAARAAARAEKEAADEVARAASRYNQGRMQAGYQLQDFFIQVEGGTPLLRAFSQQATQMTGAIALMGGEMNGTSSRFGKFAAFMAGPWGVALGVAIPLVTLLASKLMDNAEASAAAEAGANGLAAAQSSLGQIFDLVSGKLKTQNELLIINARLQAISLRADADKADANAKKITARALTIDEPGNIRGAQDYGLYLADPKKFAAATESRRQIRSLFEGVAQGGISRGDATRAAGQLRYDNSGLTKTEVTSALRDAAVAELNRRAADLIDQSLDSGRLAAELRQPGPKGRGTKGGGANGRGLAGFGESAGEKIARIADSYNPAPGGLDKAFADIRTLDRLIEDLGKRKPPSFETLISEAKDARAAVLGGIAEPIDAIQQRLIPLPEGVAKAKAAVAELDGVIAVLSDRKPPNWEGLVARARDLKAVAAESVDGPLTEMLRNSREQREQQLLILQGREREAAVLALTQQLTKDMAPLTADQRREVEDMVAAEERLNDLLTKRQDIIAIYTAGIGDLRGALEDLFSGNGGNFLKNTERLFKQMRGRLFVENMFGDSLRALEKKVRGQSPLDREISALADQVGGMERETDRSTKALKLFADTMAETTASIRQSVAAPPHALGGGDAFHDFTQPIIVTGTPRTPSQQALDAQFEYARAVTVPIVDKLDEMLGTNFFRKLEPVFSGALGGFWTAGPVGGVLGALKEFPGLPDKLKAQFGTALEGAQTGMMVAGVGKMLGIKTSSTGGAIGGALGSAVAGPAGELVGSILGSVIGGMFKKAKTGSATITGVDSDPTLSGNNKKMRAAAGDAAGSVQEVLSRIADELGGEVGSFSVSIGLRDGKYRVDPTGRGQTKVKKGAIDFGEDGTAAVMAAAFDAIGDGGITGLSAAVQRALRSSKDIDKALREALKVQEVEEIVSGLGGALERQFRAFETQAKERLRIATQYGFDVTKIEERNAQDRAALVDKILSDRIGSLQALLEDMQFGDLFEGTADERRQKLLTEIATAKSDAEKGKDGAADRLAELSRRLVESSREDYGTAGPEYASDRAKAMSDAEAIIAAENERIRAAQQATIDTSKALGLNNQLTNETNDILAEMRAMMRANSVSGGGSIGLNSLGAYRNVQL